MKMNFSKWICHVISLLLIVVLFSGCSAPDPQLQDSLSDYTEIVHSNSMDDLCLTVYYIHPTILCRPIRTQDELIGIVNGIMNDGDSGSFQINQEQLLLEKNKLQQLSAQNMKRSEKTFNANMRLCFAFESEHNGRVLEIIFSGTNHDNDDEISCVYVNNIEVENKEWISSLLQSIIRPYVPQKDIDVLDYLY